MKENKYDDEVFFEKYSQMYRSIYGLQGAGEWHEFEKLLPDFQGKRVLDLGCGYGWHCQYATEHHAQYVLGVDISKRMLETAKQKHAHPQIEYRQIAMEDLTLEPDSFDVVFSSLALHYVKDYEQLVQHIANWLTKGGNFVFSVEHPVFTSYGNQDWYYDENGNILHFPVDRYFYEGQREAVFLQEKVVKYHRTLTTYLETLMKHGFMIQHVVEPQPPLEMMNMDGMKDEMRRPMMLLIAVQKV
ncbi:class I SAM-dependent methyltransferase [Massilimicrobiota sp. An80]|uniref:class I SAM-dependent methyltransferase n=1 Tax=Massilimicrobiota sp. An80 TaxID=1965658 RepID=UPI000B4466B3|nr:class I SAM-dependent methyltransferase [Massilimicrobiota sp. An80]OUN30526.1 SAM-dependent methyltransferase [Massilimicrobiota sp. An80]